MNNKYIQILENVSIKNKYTKWYISLIKKRLETPAICDYIERHHIYPSSFDKKYSKDKNNLVTLTAREHYICHLLLTKMFSDKKLRKKMLFAYFMISRHSESENRPRYFNSYLYERGKIMNSLAMKLQWEEPEYRDNFINKLKFLWTTEEYRNKISESKKDFYSSEEWRSFLSEKAKKEMSDEERKKAFVTAGLAGAKIVRDLDTKAWVEQSMGSEDARKKAKETHQSASHREKCKQRELSKGPEELSRIGKERRQKQIEMGIEKYGSKEAYFKSMGESKKGTSAYINLDTGIVKYSKTEIEGFVLWKTLPKHIKEKYDINGSKKDFNII